MTILTRTLTLVLIVVLAFVIFRKQREIVITEPAEPQVVQQAPKPQPQAKSRPRPLPKPQPPENVTFEPENTQGQPIHRSLQAQPQPAQTRVVRREPSVYEWEASFNNAMEEKDPSKRQQRIDVAQTALNRRLEEMKLNEGDGSPQERQAIRNAQLGLNLLREEVSNAQTRR